MDFLAGLGGLTLSLIGLVVLVLFLASLYTKNYLVSIIIFVIAAFAFPYSTVDVVSLIADNWVSILAYTAVYIGIGVIWALVSWYIAIRKSAIAYKAKRDFYLPQFLAQNNLQKLEPSQYNAFKQYMLKATNKSFEYQNPSTSWVVAEIVIWPFSLLYFIFADSLTWIGYKLRTVFGGTFRRIHNRVFKRFDELA